MWKRVLVGLVGVFLLAAPAAAQEGIQVGAGVAAVELRDGGDFWGTGLGHVGGELRASLPLAKRFSLEASASFGKRRLPRGFAGPTATVAAEEIRRSEQLFSFVVKQDLGRRPTSYAFLVYGVAGVAGTTHYPDTRITYPNGNSYFYPATSYTQKNQWGFPQIGAGFETHLSRRLSVRAEARALFFLVVPVGWRASASVGYTLKAW